MAVSEKESDITKAPTYLLPGLPLKTILKLVENTIRHVAGHTGNCKESDVEYCQSVPLFSQTPHSLCTDPIIEG